MAKPQNLSILLASIVELQECIDEQFFRGDRITFKALLATQQERLERLDNARPSDNGTSAFDDRSGESTTGDL